MPDLVVSAQKTDWSRVRLISSCPPSPPKHYSNTHTELAHRVPSLAALTSAAPGVPAQPS